MPRMRQQRGAERSHQSRKLEVHPKKSEVAIRRVGRAVAAEWVHEKRMEVTMHPIPGGKYVK